MTTETCAWTYHALYDAWDTCCGEVYCFIDGGPSENRMRFCPFCGKPIAQPASAAET